MRVFLFFLPAIFVVLVGFGIYFTQGSLAWSSSGSLNSDSEKQVELGGDYYLRISLVEVASKKADNADWDKIGQAAPDPYYEIHWRDNLVYKSDVKENTLIASWSETELDLLDAALSGDKLSSDLVIAGARINVVEGEKIILKVYDSDPLSSDDLVGEVEIVASELLEGKNSISQADRLLKRLELSLERIGES